jgi:isopentenyl diphosphate isomerase/L-lactate dehydrogenase-like FMN-dependent dehydrogenase
LAFGASLVGLGRPILYALAVGGEKGVSDLIAGITRELSRLMTMVAAKDPTMVQKDILIER